MGRATTPGTRLSRWGAEMVPAAGARLRLRTLILLALLLTAWGCGRDQAETAAHQESDRAQVAAEAEEPGRGSSGSVTPVDEQPTDAAHVAGEPPEGQSGKRTAATEPLEITAAAVSEVLSDAPEYPRPELPPSDERQRPPDLRLVDLAGDEIELRQMQGQVVLLAFWATWCRPCIMEIPHLVHLVETYADAGFEVLGVSVDRGGMRAVKPFVDRHPEINYPIIPNGVPAAQTLGGIRSIPTSFLLDRQGRVLRAFVGLQPPEVLEGHIQAALLESL
ncbi:MAG: redoxin domain-containing protein [Candidatus Eisenbacteria bacterium]|nr:redoxin domain-containing protein [Candidatus Eisenbacteria bacterium]